MAGNWNITTNSTDAQRYFLYDSFNRSVAEDKCLFKSTSVDIANETLVVGFNPDVRISYPTSNVKNVEVFNENTVKVTFYDGNFETAVCDKEDEFNLETGVSLCIAKHLAGGSSKWYSMVSKAMKVYKNEQKRIAKEEAKKAESEAIKERRKVKKAAQKARREQRRIEAESAAREEQISIQAEAMIRAAKELGIGNN